MIFLALAAGQTQLPTSISPITSTTMQQQTAQQQSPPSVQQTQQTHQGQTQHSIQPQQANIISVKTPITLQPKPQIQPQPSPQQQQQQQLQQQVQQVTVHQNQNQIQMIPQTSTAIPQSISITQQGTPQTLTTTHIVQQQNQQQLQQQPRQLTILPQQSQPIQIFQTSQQPQPIRPNPSYSTTATVSVAPAGTVQTTAQMTPPNATPRANKIRKPAVARGSTPGTGPQSGQQQQPQQQAKQVFPRMPPNQTGTQQPRQIQPSQGGAGGITLQPLTRIPIVTQQQQQQILNQPLKTINMAALQPNLPDATLTPLTPQSNPILTTAPISIQQVPQQLQQVFQTNVTQLPSPNVSITPTNSLPTVTTLQQAQQQQTNGKKEDHSNDRVEIKA